MKVDLKITPQPVRIAVKTAANVVMKEANPVEKYMKLAKSSLSSMVEVLERRAEEMSPQEYLNARRYLADLEYAQHFYK